MLKPSSVILVFICAATAVLTVFSCNQLTESSKDKSSSKNKEQTETPTSEPKEEPKPLTQAELDQTLNMDPSALTCQEVYSKWGEVRKALETGNQTCTQHSDCVIKELSCGCCGCYSSPLRRDTALLSRVDEAKKSKLFQRTATCGKTGCEAADCDTDSMDYVGCYEQKCTTTRGNIEDDPPSGEKLSCIFLKDDIDKMLRELQSSYSHGYKCTQDSDCVGISLPWVYACYEQPNYFYATHKQAYEPVAASLGAKYDAYKKCFNEVLKSTCADMPDAKSVTCVLPQGQCGAL